MGDSGNRYRLRLPREIGLVVPWLKSDSNSIECICTLGAAGGIAIIPKGVLQPSLRSVEPYLTSVSATPWESGSDMLRLVRYLASMQAVSIGVEQTRFSLTIPEAVRKLGVAPDSGQAAVVFAMGSVLEVWRADAWSEHIRQAAGSFNALRADALEAIIDPCE